MDIQSLAGKRRELVGGSLRAFLSFRLANILQMANPAVGE